VHLPHTYVTQWCQRRCCLVGGNRTVSLQADHTKAHIVLCAASAAWLCFCRQICCTNKRCTHLGTLGVPGLVAVEANRSSQPRSYGETRCPAHAAGPCTHVSNGYIQAPSSLARTQLRLRWWESSSLTTYRPVHQPGLGLPCVPWTMDQQVLQSDTRRRVSTCSLCIVSKCQPPTAGA
jgi:hypothetical protein